MEGPSASDLSTALRTGPSSEEYEANDASDAAAKAGGGKKYGPVRVNTRCRKNEGDGNPSALWRHPSYIPSFRNSQGEGPTVNPFVNSTMTTPWHQLIKMIAFGAVLVPIRAVLTIVAVLWMWIFSSIALFNLSAEDEREPWPKWRCLMRHPVAWGVRFQLFCFGFIWIKEQGRCASKEEAPIVIANHVSPFEPLFLVCKTRASPIQRIEDSKAPIVGKIQRAFQLIFVNRADPHSRRDTVETIKRRADPDSGESFSQIVIMPEGTCNNQRALITFKSGAFYPGRPIQPVLVRYPYKWLDPSFPAVSPSLGVLFLKMMCQLWNTLEVEYLPVYNPSQEEIANPDLYAANMQTLMAAGLGIPSTQHAYEDVSLQFAAMKLKLPAEAAVVEWGKVREALQINTETAQLYLKHFQGLDKDGDGKLNFEEFAGAWRSKNLLWAAGGGGAGGGGGDLEAGEGRGGNEEEEEKRRKRKKKKMRWPWEKKEEDKSENESEGAHGADAVHREGAREEEGKEGGEEEEEEAGPIEAFKSFIKDIEEDMEEEEAEEGLRTLDDEMVKIFELFDVDDSGMIDFRQFLTGLAVLNGLSREGSIDSFKLAFSVLDKEEVGSIQTTELAAFLRRLFPSMPFSKAGEMAADADKKGSGRVSRDAFLEFAKKNEAVLQSYTSLLFNEIVGTDFDASAFEQQPWLPDEEDISVTNGTNVSTGAGDDGSQHQHSSSSSSTTSLGGPGLARIKSRRLQGWQVGPRGEEPEQRTPGGTGPHGQAYPGVEGLHQGQASMV